MVWLLKLKRKNQLLRMFVFAHSINLCLQTVYIGKQITAIREALDLMQELGVLTSFSPKQSS